MSQPPDDPFYSNRTENASWPSPWSGQGQGQSQQAGTPRYTPAYPPDQGPPSRPGFTPFQQDFPRPNPGSNPGFQQDFPRPNPGSNPGFQQDFPRPNAGGPPPSWPPNFPPPGANPVQQPPVFTPNVMNRATTGQPQSLPPVMPGRTHSNDPEVTQQDFPRNQPQRPYGVPPAPNNVPPDGSQKFPKSFIILILIVIAFLLFAGVGALLVLHGKSQAGTAGSRSTAVAQSTPTNIKKGITPTPTPNTNPSTGTIGTVGQPIQAGLNWVATVTHVDETTNSLIPPSAGETYLEISISLKNVSATTQPVSSVVQFLLVDSNGHAYSSVSGAGDTNVRHPLDGNVASGQTLEGQISYEVPQSMHAFTLSFEYNLIQGSSATISWPLHV